MFAQISGSRPAWDIGFDTTLTLYFWQVFISLAFRKCKKDCKILKGILLKGYCPQKNEIARFPIGYRLNFFQLRSSVSVCAHTKLLTPLAFKQ